MQTTSKIGTVVLQTSSLLSVWLPSSEDSICQPVTPDIDCSAPWSCTQSSEQQLQSCIVASYLVKADLVWVSTSFMGSSAQSCLVLNFVTSSRKSMSSRARQYPCIYRQGQQLLALEACGTAQRKLCWVSCSESSNYWCQPPNPLHVTFAQQMACNWSWAWLSI